MGIVGEAEKKGGRAKILEETMAKHFPDLKENINLHTQEAKSKQDKCKFTPKNIILEKEYWKQQEKGDWLRKRDLQFIRNHEGQSVVGWHIQNAERKVLSTKSSISSKTIPQKWKEIEIIPAKHKQNSLWADLPYKKLD